MNTTSEQSAEVLRALRDTLLRLARRERELAIDESARVAYWEPCPLSVLAHRAAATALEAEATHLSVAS